MKKKIFTLVFSLIALCVFFMPGEHESACAAAVPPVIEDGIVTLVDFGVKDKFPAKYAVTKYKTEMDESVKYSGKETSLKWEMSTNTNLDLYLSENSDLTKLLAHPDATLNVRFYCEKSGVKFNYVHFGNASSPNFWYKAITTTGGWQVYSLKLDTVLNGISYSTHNALRVRINDNGWNNKSYTAGDVIYFDSVYISLPSYGNVLSAPSSSVQNGSSYLETDLGNNNTFTLEYSENLWDGNHIANGSTYSVSDYVTVYEYNNGTYEETLQPYSVVVSGQKLNVVFESALNDLTAYKIVADSDAILSITGKKMNDDCQYYFSVGTDSAIFTVNSTQPANGTKVNGNIDDFEYLITFNNELPSQIDLLRIDVKKDGEKISGYRAISDSKNLKLVFPNGLEGDCEYEVILSDKFADKNGFIIQGKKDFKFTTIDVVKSDGIIFDSSDNKSIQKVLSSNTSARGYSVEKETENCILSDKSVKLNHPEVSSDTNQYTFVMSNKQIENVYDYTYINYLIYSPAVSNEKIVLMLTDSEAFHSGEKKWSYKMIPTDWQGWKTVSIKLSDFTSVNMSGYVDEFIINIGGFGATKAQSGYFLIDRMWLSEDEPSSIDISSSEFSDGAIYVPANLGGDDKFSFEFTTTLYESDYSNAVEIQKYNGSEYADYDDYIVSVNGNKLDIEFLNHLSDGDTYTITIKKDCILNSDLSVFKDDIERTFTINAPSPFFTVVDSSVLPNSTITELSDITFTFNNEIGSGIYFPDCLFIYKDGVKQYNVYNASVSGKNLTLTFKNKLGNGIYTIKLENTIYDSYQNSYVGATELIFTISNGETNASSLILLTAGNSDQMSKLSTLQASTEITNLYSVSAKAEYSEGIGSAATKNIWLRYRDAFNTSGLNYMNILMYLPEVTENTANIVLYTNQSSNSYGRVYPLPLNWSGWKIISIPMTSLGSSQSYDSVLFNLGAWNYTTVYDSGYILVDALWLSKEKPSDMILESTSFNNGYSEADVYGERLVLKFNKNLGTDFVPKVLLKDNQNNIVSDYTVLCTGNTIEIVFGDLNPSTRYDLNISNIVSEEFVGLSKQIDMHFVTLPGNVSLKDIYFDNNTLYADLSNTTQKDTELSLVVYSIGEDNRLVDSVIQEFNLSSGQTVRKSVSDIISGDTKQVKAYVIDKDRKIISKKYVLINNGVLEEVNINTASGTEKKITINSSGLSVNVLEVKGEVSNLQDAVIINITDISGRVISSNIVSCNNDGTFEYFYVLSNELPTGTYTIKCESNGVYALKDIKYVSANDRNALLSLANSGNSSQLSNQISNLKQYLGLGNKTDEQISDISKRIIAHRTYYNYEDVCDMINKLTVLMDDINSKPWTLLTDFIIDNADIFCETNNEDILYLKNLNEKQKNTFAKYLNNHRPLSTFDELLSKIKLSLTEYKKSLNSSDGSSQVGSSSGGFGGASFPVSSVNNQANGGSGAVVFNDLDTAPWAKESILTLHKSGIISDPASDSKYRPNDAITREEFVKLLVCAFATDTEYQSHKFADEENSAWYNKYLSISYSLGIVTGYEDGSFGIGKNITREDLVTISARLLESRNEIIVSDEGAAFVDSGDIAPYAQKYVYSLSKIGVVNGVGDNKFLPKSTATRAEAAKIICGLLEYCK